MQSVKQTTGSNFPLINKVTNLRVFASDSYMGNLTEKFQELSPSTRDKLQEILGTMTSHKIKSILLPSTFTPRIYYCIKPIRKRNNDKFLHLTEILTLC